MRQGGVRRGAGMATMSISNPDVEDFITCKDLDREAKEGDISTFNISILASDVFMSTESSEGILRRIADHAHSTGEPGIVFVDRINEHNLMHPVMGDIKATNPCGEIVLYPGEPCDLGAMNLAAYIDDEGYWMSEFFERDVKLAVRMLDNILEVNNFALEQNEQLSKNLRRLGLGVMGLADYLIKSNIPYNSERARIATKEVIGVLRIHALRASEELAKERGVFPFYDEELGVEPRRNVALLTTAPTGTTSMIMGVSGGVEPVFAPFIYRKVGSDYIPMISPLFEELMRDFYNNDPPTVDKLMEGLIEKIQANHGSVQGIEEVPQHIQDVFVCAHDIAPEDHVEMQGAVQRAFDEGGKKVGNSISKTINLPNSATVDDVYSAYKLAFELECKGITVYRDGSRSLQVFEH